MSESDRNTAAEGQLPVAVAKIKREKVTPPPSPDTRTTTALGELLPTLFKDENAEPAATTPHEDSKKDIQPAKSSNEILADLFRVFNAAPPDALLGLADAGKKSSHKKHKKHKKKSKKRKREVSISDLSEIDSSESGEGAGDRKKEKKKSRLDKKSIKKEHRNKSKELEKLQIVVKQEGERTVQRDQPDKVPKKHDEKVRSKAAATIESVVVRGPNGCASKTDIKTSSTSDHHDSSRHRDHKRDDDKRRPKIENGSDVSLSDEETYKSRRERELQMSRDREHLVSKERDLQKTRDREHRISRDREHRTSREQDLRTSRDRHPSRRSPVDRRERHSRHDDSFRSSYRQSLRTR